MKSHDVEPTNLIARHIKVPTVRPASSIPTTEGGEEGTGEGSISRVQIMPRTKLSRGRGAAKSRKSRPASGRRSRKDSAEARRTRGTIARIRYEAQGRSVGLRAARAKKKRGTATEHEDGAADYVPRQLPFEEVRDMPGEDSRAAERAICWSARRVIGQI